jgi:hypothetical protein
MTKQLQLLFTLVFGDLFTPFLFQTAHFSSLIFIVCQVSIIFNITPLYEKSNYYEKKSVI